MPSNDHRPPLVVRLIRLGTLAVAAAAVVRELRTPSAQRTWHGTIVGVPYDFRAPTARRVRRRVWAPDDPRLLMPQGFGVGWTLNLARLVQLVRPRRRRR